MGSCPVCNNPVADDFGLVECQSCGAQLIVHVDGTVEYSGSADEAEATPEPAPVNVAPEEPESPQLGPEVDFEEPQDSPPIHQFSEDELNAVQEGELPPVEPPAQESSAWMDEAPAVYKSESAPDSPDLSDLADFANSSDSGGREGPFRYTLSISGIDTSDVRLAFREAITDRKFMWDTDQILRSIRQGQVVISNISPGKAYILINRLRGLPVDVSWEQNAVTQP